MCMCDLYSVYLIPLRTFYEREIFNFIHICIMLTKLITYFILYPLVVKCSLGSLIWISNYSYYRSLLKNLKVSLII